MKHLNKPLITLLTLSPVLLTACASPQIKTDFVCERVDGDLPAAVKEVNTAPLELPHTKQLLIDVNKHNEACDILEAR